MGLLFSVEKPPPVVLVPPLFHRPEFASRYRMTNSSYDVLFAKIARTALFTDYYREADDIFLRLMLKPPEDQNVDFIAAFSGSSKEGKNPNGEATFRWHPTETDTNNFLELNTSTWIKKLRLRTCTFYPPMGLGTFASISVLPISRQFFEHFGLRYESSSISAGTRVDIGSGGPSCIWFVGKLGKITAGSQFQSKISFSELQSAWKDSILHEIGKPQNWNFAINYGSGTSGPLTHSFNFCLEAQANSKLICSYYQHLVVQRKIRNPFESSEVVAITNYIDLGVEFQQSIRDCEPDLHMDGSSKLLEMQIGVSWQANKNFLLKGKLGNSCSAFAFLHKFWWQPSSTFSLSENVQLTSSYQ
ncbi:hypothetical protein KP509_22G020300 [Ceratopteris richardii]|uniref:Uncharacterized protein n=1 Tax=Ceratopteris richardii TaxID=49495 RepID=A0A8T2S5T1_CERRI|nr:hypothetical protein KP509_22G020300 [Ceratopteris richardii]